MLSHLRNTKTQIGAVIQQKQFTMHCFHYEERTVKSIS